MTFILLKVLSFKVPGVEAGVGAGAIGMGLFLGAIGTNSVFLGGVTVGFGLVSPVAGGVEVSNLIFFSGGGAGLESA